jgi:hypothetical protein
MKFIFADSLDTVDPGYNFLTDRNAAYRTLHWDDEYPHELMETLPYDGVLVSRAVVGDQRPGGKYTSAQAMRFRRVGARRFLRMDSPRCRDLPIFGDCGAFSYVTEPVPPYTPADMLDFYSDAGFTHGCSVDHIIFDFDREECGLAAGTPDARERYDITLENAVHFLRLSRDLGPGFTPIGVAQGWSPSSITESAARLELMGYDYIAIGGLVPLRAEDIHRCLQAIRQRLSSNTRIHLLGFAKAEQIDQFVRYGITSFDSTSPLIRAFKDAKSNYYLAGPQGLEYYSAIRIPQALENTRLMRCVKAGQLHQEVLVKLETTALAAVRGYDKGAVPIEDAVEAVAEYGSLLATDTVENSFIRERMRQSIREQTQRTLSARPWKRCTCKICVDLSVEVMIFRASNRNKRRGFHNLGVFHEHVRRLLNKEAQSDHVHVSRRTG